MSTKTAQCVAVDLPHHRYTVHIGAGLLSQLGSTLRPLTTATRCSLFADANVVAETYGPAAQDALQDASFDTQLMAVPIAESAKNLQTVAGLYTPLIEHKMERRSVVVSLGGGVLGDTVGYVAASYLRGVPFVQCPTTLLSMVDASVGGKVGVNLPEGKNLVGAFHQPIAVVIDTNTLNTLPVRELRCGLAECVKHGAIRDPQLLQWIQDHRDALFSLDASTLAELVRQNVAIKASVVMQDERESGVRAHLNFGHTFGHAIEALTGYGRGEKSYHHGEAVSLGMVAAARLSVELNLLTAAEADHIITLLDQLDLPICATDLPDTDTLIKAMTRDKKVQAGRVRLVLLNGLGQAVIREEVDTAQVKTAWESLRS